MATSEIANCRGRTCGLALAIAVFGAWGNAYAYDFWEYDAGRADFAARYDLSGTPWPGQNNAIYDFGQIGTFAVTPPGVSNAWLSAAVNDATSDWEKWGNIAFADNLGTSGSGRVRLMSGIPTTPGAPAETSFTLIGSLIGYVTITFNEAKTWTQDLFTGVLKHELGHVLGLDDLYTSSAPLSEEFVDHPVDSTAIPDRTPSSRQDNIMDGTARAGWYYDSPHLVIDNDEIAALTWLWGGYSNQIVTGDLVDAWNPTYHDRDTAPHHGNDPNNGLGWWDYRGSIVSPRADGAFPYIDLQFPGYEDFTAVATGGAPWTHESLGNGVERFTIQQANWTGNFELSAESHFTRQGRINAWIQGAGLDQFILPLNIDGLVFTQDLPGQYMWPTVYGPVPEPPTMTLVMLSLAGLAIFGRFFGWNNVDPDMRDRTRGRVPLAALRRTEAVYPA